MHIELVLSGIHTAIVLLQCARSVTILGDTEGWKTGSSTSLFFFLQNKMLGSNIFQRQLAEGEKYNLKYSKVESCQQAFYFLVGSEAGVKMKDGKEMYF